MKSCLMILLCTNMLLVVGGAGTISAQDQMDVLQVLVAHEGSIEDLEFSPDGILLASCSKDQTVKVWRIHDGSLHQTFTGHDGRVNALSFTNDGTSLASGSDDKSVRIWRISDGIPIRRFDYPLKVRSVDFRAGDAEFAAATDNRRIYVTKIAEGAPAAAVMFDPPPGDIVSDYDVKAVAYSPDGRYFAASGGGGGQRDQKIIVWDATSFAKIRELCAADCFASEAIAFSPDGNSLVGFPGYHNPLINNRSAIQLWETQYGRCIVDIPLTVDKLEEPNTLSVSPGGTLLAAGFDDKTIRIWTLPSDLPSIAVSAPHVSPFTPAKAGYAAVGTFDKKVKAVAFSLDGAQIACGLDDGTIHFLSIPKYLHGRDLSAALPMRIARLREALDREEQSLAAHAAAKWETLMVPRSEFETTPQYEQRITHAQGIREQAESIYLDEIIHRRHVCKALVDSLCSMSSAIQLDAKLGTYDADQQIFPVTVHDVTHVFGEIRPLPVLKMKAWHEISEDQLYTISVPRADAPALKAAGQWAVTGIVKYRYECGILTHTIESLELHSTSNGRPAMTYVLISHKEDSVLARAMIARRGGVYLSSTIKAASATTSEELLAEEPSLHIAEGEVIDILAITDGLSEAPGEGIWLKARASNGSVGYIPNCVKLLETHGDRGAMVALILSDPYEFECNIAAVDAERARYSRFISSHPNSPLVPMALVKQASLDGYLLQCPLDEAARITRFSATLALYDMLANKYQLDAWSDEAAQAHQFIASHQSAMCASMVDPGVFVDWMQLQSQLASAIPEPDYLE